MQTLTGLGSGSDMGSESMRAIMNDTQIPSSGSSLWDRTFTKEEPQEVEMMTVIPALGISNLRCPRDIHWAIGTTVLMLSKEILVIELPLRHPLEAEALILMATVLQPFLSTHWCLQKAPYLPPVSFLVSPCSSLYLRRADVDGISLSCSHLFCLEVWCHPYFQWEGPNEAFKFADLVTDFPFSSSRAQTCIHSIATDLCSMPCFVLEMRYPEMQKHDFRPQGACFEETDIHNYNVIQWLDWPVYG